MKRSRGPSDRPIHPALHFDEDRAFVGILDANGVAWIVGSDRSKHSLDALAKAGRLQSTTHTYPPLAGRWPEWDLTRFLTGDFPRPMLGPVFDAIATQIDFYCELSDRRHVRLIASWILGTYVFPLFPTFPRLHFRGDPGTGKSKLLQLVSVLSFNGLWRISPTPAVLFRLISPHRASICLDEMENLDTFDRKELLAIINAGYKAGGCLDRTQKVADNFTVVPFEVFAPLAFGGVAPLNRVTADRAIQILTVKGSDRERLNRDVSETQLLVTLRAACYEFALSHFRAIRHTYQSHELPPWLIARHRELFGPLLAIAALADAQGADGVTNDLLALAREEAPERNGIPADIETVLDLLRTRMNGAIAVVVRPIDLAEAATSEGVPLSAKRVALLLDGFGFKKASRDKHSVRYRVTAHQLAAAVARHTPWVTYTPTPDPSHAKHSSNLGGVDAGEDASAPSKGTYTPGGNGNGVAADWPPCGLCGLQVPRVEFAAHVRTAHGDVR